MVLKGQFDLRSAELGDTTPGLLTDHRLTETLLPAFIVLGLTFGCRCEFGR